jgi:hypothetical protein
MADSIFAAASTTPASSSERIASEFQAQGRPDNPAFVPSQGEILGGFEIKTPKVGDGFTEWAVNGYDLEGKTKQVPDGVCYDKHGDWMFDKSHVHVPATVHGVYEDNYLKKEK